MERICPCLRVLWRAAWGAGTVEPARYLHDHELVLVTKGSCVVEMEGGQFPLTPGDYVIIPPNRCHTTICRKSVFRTCIHFDWLPRPGPARKLIWSYAPHRPSAKDIATAPRFVPQSVYRGRFSMGGPVLGLLDTIFFRWQSGTPHGTATARAGFLELLAHLFLDQKNPNDSTPAQTHFQLARSVKSLLDSNITTGSGIQELLESYHLLEINRRHAPGEKQGARASRSCVAQRFRLRCQAPKRAGRSFPLVAAKSSYFQEMVSLGFSYAHLCRIFHASFGLTPVEYRNTARLEQAKTLLRDTSLTIAEIAYRAGFQDPAYFTRQFRAGPANISRR